MKLPSDSKNLFVPADDKKNEATISSEFFRSKYWEYETAYKTAGDLLVNKAIEDGSLFLCVSIYPIMFVYRQFLELYIKDILLRFDKEFDSKKPPYNNHDVCNLWRRLLAIVRENKMLLLLEIEGQDFVDVLSATDAYFTELAAADRNSFSFRYPDDKAHTKYFFPNEIPVDLNNLKERIEELANVLFLIEETFTNIQTIEEELEAQMY